MSATASTPLIVYNTRRVLDRAYAIRTEMLSLRESVADDGEAWSSAHLVLQALDQTIDHMLTKLVQYPHPVNEAGVDIEAGR